MRILTLDFETKDPYLGLGLGPGWVYYMHLKEKSLFRPLGMAYRTNDGEEGYISNWEKAKELVNNHDALLAHNSQYDFGILGALGINIKNKVLLDTKILAFLYNNLGKTHLDILGKMYCNINKSTDTLGNAVWDLGLWPWTKAEDGKKTKADKLGLVFERVRPSQDKLNKFAYENMELMHDICYKIVADYSLVDIKITWALYEFFTSKGVKCTYYSDVLKALMQSRARGVTVDLDATRKAHLDLTPMIVEALNKVYKIAGREFNIGSSKEVSEVLRSLGINLPLTEKGSDSANDKVLSKLPHPIAQAIRDARKLIKFDRDFIQKIIEIQQYTMGIPPEEVDSKHQGIIYPHMQLFGAATGRFSCQGPNIQQIPARGNMSELCRKIFVPSKGKWGCLDLSNQEGRIQIHVSNSYGCEGSNKLVDLFKENPKFDIHREVAEMLGITRAAAKTINLGLSYGMGKNSLAGNLGITVKQTDAILKKYHELVPYLKGAIDEATNRIKRAQYVNTVKGRVLRREINYEYKIFNYIMQGSAADQIIEIIRSCYKQDIKVLFAVHDEMNIEIENQETFDIVKSIMEQSMPLCIPMVAEGGVGKNWAEAKPKS